MMNRKDDHSSLCLVVVAEHGSNNAKEQEKEQYLDRNNKNGVNIHKDRHEDHDEDSSASEEFEPIPYTTKNTSSGVVVGLDDGGGDEEDEVELPYQEYNQKRDKEQGNRKTAAISSNEKIHNVSSTRMRRSSASIPVSGTCTSPSKEDLNKNDDQSSKPSWCPKTKKLLCDLLFELDPTHDSNSFPAGEEQKEQGVVEEAHRQEQDQNQLREDYGGRAGDEAAPLVSSLHYSNRSGIPLYYNPNNYSHSYYYHAPFNHTYSWSMQESSSSYAEVGSTSSTAGQISNDADDSSAFCHDSATSTMNTSHRHETNNHYCCYSYGGQEDNKSKNSYYDGDEEQQRKGSEQHHHWNKPSGDDSKHCQEINLHPPLYHDHHTALNQQFYTTPIFTSNITTPSITLPPDSIDGNYYSQQHSFYDSSAILVGNQHYHYDESSFPASQYHGYSDIEYHRQRNLNLRVSDIVGDQQFLPSRSSDGDNDTTQDDDGQQMKSWHTAEYNFNSKNISPDLYCTTRGTSQDCSLSQHQHGEEYYGNEQQEGDAEKSSLKRKASNISQSQHRTDAMLSAIPQKLRKISNELSIRITSSAPLDDTFNTSMYDAVSGDSHCIPQTSTTDTTDNVQHDCQSLPVVISSDKKYATKYSYRVMKEVTLAYFDESDRRGKRQNIPVGFPGLACKHCHGVRTAPQAELNDLNLPLYQRTGRYFPSTLKSFSDTKKTLNAIFSHLMRCQKCPREVKQKLVQLEKEHSSERAAKNYGSQSRFFLRIWHRIHKTETSNSVS